MGKRAGLMRARVAGARVATGATLTFLDSHISCDIGWLEPLMFRIAQGRWHIVMPMIDGADRQYVTTASVALSCLEDFEVALDCPSRLRAVLPFQPCHCSVVPF